jgi:hypothetical protein
MSNEALLFLGTSSDRADDLRIVFFAPHSEIWIHAFPEALVAEALKQHGHEIVYIGCGRLLRSHCVVMSAHSVPFSATPAAKDRICRSCGKNLRVLRDNFSFNGPDLGSLANESDMSMAEELIASTPSAEHVNLVLDGVEVGRVALYEMVIQRKRGNLNFDAAEAMRYRASLKNVIVVLQVVKRLFDELKPDRVVLYNALYSVNRVVCRLAALRGIPQYYLHAGDNLSMRLKSLVLARDHAFSYCKHLRDVWSQYRDRPCPLDAMQAATNHLLEVARGRSMWAYSAPSEGNIDLKTRFSIEGGQKVICATMSSDDERFGGETIGVLPTLDHLLFPKQVDWIRALIAFVDKRKDLFLIIRVHPREFPNKREGVLSEHARMLQEAFVKLPNNVVINWPSDNISLYDVANITDVFANAWSSAGREMAWLGLPVVLYADDLALYPSDLNYVGTSMPAYFGKMVQALSEGWNEKWIRQTYRWCAVDLFYSLLDISESFSRDEYLSRMKKGLKKAVSLVAPTYEVERDCRDRAESLAAGAGINRIITENLAAPIDLQDLRPCVTYEEETFFLKQEVRRLVLGLYGEPNTYSKGSLAAKLLDFATS